MNTRHRPTVGLTVAAVSIASLMGALTHSSFAQITPTQSGRASAADAARAVARGGMTEDQVVAMHAVLKRATVAKTSDLDRNAAAESD